MRQILRPLISTCAILAALCPSAQAFQGTVSFTDQEKATHLAGLPAIMDTANKCLAGELARHNKFEQRYRISAFYGDQSSFAKKRVVDPVTGQETTVETTVKERRQQLRDLGFEDLYVNAFVPLKQCNGLKDCPNMLQPTSCINIARKCLGDGFTAAGQTDLWKKINAYTVMNDITGDAFINALQALGWKVVYWNPDVNMDKQWDTEEAAKFGADPHHAAGHHEYAYLTVSKKNRYLYNTVDDFTSMVNFGTGTPDLIKRVPFFVGIAHLGYHVFSGSYGVITEGHSTRAVTDPHTVETSAFAPLAVDGGPRGGPYRSGIVAIPPGYLN